MKSVLDHFLCNFHMRNLALEFHISVSRCLYGNVNINTLLHVQGPWLTHHKLNNILFTQRCKVYEASH